MRRVSAALLVGLLLLGACSSDADSSVSADQVEPPLPDRVVPLLDAVGETILGQEFAYPDGDTQVTASILTLQPGEETGWHHHDAPLFAYIMENTVADE